MNLIPEEIIHLLHLKPSYFHDQHELPKLDKIKELHYIGNVIFREGGNQHSETFLAIVDHLEDSEYWVCSSVGTHTLVHLNKLTFNKIKEGKPVSLNKSYNTKLLTNSCQCWSNEMIILQICFK